VLCPTVDGLTVAHGADVLGQIQQKHVRWAAALTTFRLAALAVTGGTEERPTMGVNVVMEVWPALPAPSPTATEAPADSADEAPFDEFAATAEAEREAEGRRFVMEADEERAVFGRRAGPHDLWHRLGGWDQ
jgi:hypothetical protein